MVFGVQGVYGSVLTKCFNLFFREKKFQFFLPPKRPPKVFWGSKHVSQKWLQRLHFSIQMKFFTCYWFYRPGAMTFKHKIGRVPLTLWLKFLFLNDLIFAASATSPNWSYGNQNLTHKVSGTLPSLSGKVIPLGPQNR